MTVDLDELAQLSRKAVNEDPDGTMTLPTQTIRVLVARLQIAETIVRDLAVFDPSDSCEMCGARRYKNEPHAADCLITRAVEDKP